MAAGRSSRKPSLRLRVPRFRLHHWATLFIAGLILTHLSITWKNIQQEQVWSPNSPFAQRLMKSLKVLLVESYMPRTRLNNRRSCPVVDHVPKVALLFMATDGIVRHEAAWRAWFQGAEGLLPIAPFEAGGLPPQLGLCAKALANSRGVPLSRQWLFSAYVHRPPGVPPLPLRHTFAGHHIKSTAQAEWGHHSLVVAARALLTAALEDPTNHKFQLLSGTTLPLWSPPVVYSRLMAESTSHLDACHHQAAAVPAELALALDLQGVELRRSSPYFTLLRAHAALASHDTSWEPRFASACKATRANNTGQTMCASDEYYFPTLIAAVGQAGSTACHGGVVQDSWSPEDATAPRMEWDAANVTAARFAAVRSNGGRCQADQLLRSVLPAFRTVSALAASQHSPMRLPLAAACGGSSTRDRRDNRSNGKLRGNGGACFLFARRFPETTSQAVLSLLLDTSSNLSIVQDPGEYDPRRHHKVAHDCPH